jgi:hypothetical protein
MITAAYSGTIPPTPLTGPPPSTWTARSRSQPFTLDGDSALESHLERTCARVLSGVRGLIPEKTLEALFLAGGYGRGEGGVLRRPESEDRPYNDLEFYVAIAGNRHLNEFRYRRRLEVLGEILTPLAGIEVEFKITSLAELAARPVSMFSYDLVEGHRLIWGRPDAHLLADCGHHHCAENIPTEEATRLLMNRGSGLLFARDLLERASESPAPADTDFIRRNIAKAELAGGDAILATQGLYTWSCRERHRRLEAIREQLPADWRDALLRRHADGVAFKLHPVSDEVSREELQTRLAEATALLRDCWLWVESRRLGKNFSSVRAYLEDPGDKGASGSSLRHVVLNLRADGWRARRRSWQALQRHPRPRIFYALAILLWERESLADSPELRARLNAELNWEAEAPDAWLPAYRALWARVR